MYYQRLFNYISDEYQWVLSDSEMQDLIDFIHKEYPEVKSIKVEELESDGVEEKLVEEW